MVGEDNGSVVMDKDKFWCNSQWKFAGKSDLGRMARFEWNLEKAILRRRKRAKKRRKTKNRG